MASTGPKGEDAPDLKDLESAKGAVLASTTG